jgi:hypothetical protein
LFFFSSIASAHWRSQQFDCFERVIDVGLAEILGARIEEKEQEGWGDRERSHLVEE